jgi:hypothetical protein
MEAVKVNNSEAAMKAFFNTYSHDIKGSMHNMTKKELLEYLGTFDPEYSDEGVEGDLEDPHNYSPSDIFIGCASAASGIPEHNFIVFAVEQYFEF